MMKTIFIILSIYYLYYLYLFVFIAADITVAKSQCI